MVFFLASRSVSKAEGENGYGESINNSATSVVWPLCLLERLWVGKRGGHLCTTEQA